MFRYKCPIWFTYTHIPDQFDHFHVTGSGFSVVILLKEANLAPLYQSVNHVMSNDNDDLGEDGLSQVRDLYCEYPLPEKYKLSHQLHRVSLTLYHIQM